MVDAPPALPFPAAEVLEEVVVPPRDTTLPLPDLRLIVRPGWVQVIAPSFRQGGFNHVAHAELTDADADAVIDAVIGEYRALGCRFRWTVDPGSAPGDLPARLARRGLALAWSHGMARSTATADDALPSDLAIDRVDRANVDAYTQTMAAGWGVDPGPLARANALAIDAPGSRHRLFLARAAGVPVGTAAYVAFTRSAYLLGAVVLPPWRGRGVYRALVTARLRDAHAAGLRLATSHARATSSAPILTSLGFHSMCRFPVLSG